MIPEKLRGQPGSITEPAGAMATAAFVVGGLLVIWLSYIHFHLWQSLGYRKIPTIGGLFLFQSVAGLFIGLTIIWVRRVWVAVLGAGFALATLVGFLLSVEKGLFGFTDSWSAPFADLAFILEIVTIGILVFAGGLCLARSGFAREQT
jgi:hypothetical protein